jgi:MFS transporter, SP family, sugar:H+ symporter
LLLKWLRRNVLGRTQSLAFSKGPIVGILTISIFIGATAAVLISNTRWGRKYSICLWCIIFLVGITVQISSISPPWCQIVVGRTIATLGLGALSVVVPMYQAETSPQRIRKVVDWCYQPSINIDTLVADFINFGNE